MESPPPSRSPSPMMTASPRDNYNDRNRDYGYNGTKNDDRDRDEEPPSPTSTSTSTTGTAAHHHYHSAASTPASGSMPRVHSYEQPPRSNDQPHHHHYSHCPQDRRSPSSSSPTPPPNFAHNDGRSAPKSCPSDDDSPTNDGDRYRDGEGRNRGKDGKDMFGSGFGGFTMRRYNQQQSERHVSSSERENDLVLPSPRQLEANVSSPPTPTTATRSSFLPTLPPPFPTAPGPLPAMQLPSFATSLKRKQVHDWDHRERGTSENDNLAPLPKLSTLDIGGGGISNGSASKSSTGNGSSAGGGGSGGRSPVQQYPYMPPMALPSHHSSGSNVGLGPPPAKRRNSAIDAQIGHLDMYDARRHSIHSSSLGPMGVSGLGRVRSSVGYGPMSGGGFGGRGAAGAVDGPPGTDAEGDERSPTTMMGSGAYGFRDRDRDREREREEFWLSRRRDSAASFYSSTTSFGGSTNGSVTTFCSEQQTTPPLAPRSSWIPNTSGAASSGTSASASTSPRVMRKTSGAGPQLAPLLSNNFPQAPSISAPSSANEEGSERMANNVVTAPSPLPPRTADSTGSFPASATSFASSFTSHSHSQSRSPVVESYDGRSDSANSSSTHNHAGSFSFQQQQPQGRNYASSRLGQTAASGGSPSPSLSAGSPLSPAFNNMRAPLRRMSVPDLPIAIATARRPAGGTSGSGSSSRHRLHLNTAGGMNGPGYEGRLRSPSSSSSSAQGGRPLPPPILPVPPNMPLSSPSSTASPSPATTDQGYSQQQQQQQQPYYSHQQQSLPSLGPSSTMFPSPSLSGGSSRAAGEIGTGGPAEGPHGGSTSAAKSVSGAPPGPAGSGTGTSTTAGPYSRTPELRVSHKLAERKRRKEMKDLFDELRESLPADRGMKASKWEILTKAVDFINQLKETANARQDELEQLRRENAMFRNQTYQPSSGSHSYHQHHHHHSANSNSHHVSSNHHHQSRNHRSPSPRPDDPRGRDHERTAPDGDHYMSESAYRHRSQESLRNSPGMSPEP